MTHQKSLYPVISEKIRANLKLINKNLCPKLSPVRLEKRFVQVGQRKRLILICTGSVQIKF